jgi:hypothetical protein
VLENTTITFNDFVVVDEDDVVYRTDYDERVISLSKTSSLPDNFELLQNYPNPFNPTTTIEMAFPAQADYTLSIFNVTGQLVQEYSGSSPAGTVNIEWNGTNSNGRNVTSGIYFYRLNAGSFAETKKMVLLK